MVKKKVLEILKQNNDHISGENISKELGVSRTAIWKYINALREEGYEIESITRRGYKLLSTPDILTYEEIKEYLNTEFIGRKIYYFDTLESTNNYAKEIAIEEAEGTTIVAEEQTKGKGRLGRTWLSPKGKGIYFSVILKPKFSPMEVAKITLLGAAAVNRALDDLGIKSSIKWPNDIVIGGRKVCGILTEMSSELSMINYVVMGIGINANFDQADIPLELQDKATSLKLKNGKNINRRELLAAILNHLEDLYLKFNIDKDLSEAIKACRDKSAVIGKDIKIIYGKEVRRAKAINIDDQGQLIVQMEDGSREKIISGEISIRNVDDSYI